jgi:hypothetical protein
MLFIMLQSSTACGSYHAAAWQCIAVPSCALPLSCQAVMRAAGVETRHALFQELGVLGPSVFLNAGPFLRVRRSSAELANADLMVRLPSCSVQDAGLVQPSRRHAA